MSNCYWPSELTLAMWTINLLLIAAITSSLSGKTSLGIFLPYEKCKKMVLFFNLNFFVILLCLLDAFGGFFSKIEGRRDPAVVEDASLIDELFRDRTDYSRESEYSKMSP